MIENDEEENALAPHPVKELSAVMRILLDGDFTIGDETFHCHAGDTINLYRLVNNP